MHCAVLTTYFDGYSALVLVFGLLSILDNCLHFYLSGDELPQCVTSQCPLTAKHILIECNPFCDVHHKYFVMLLE